MDSMLSLEDTGCDRQLMYDGSDQSLLAECMPQLSFGIMQYDSTVPATIFSDGSSEDESVESAWPSEVDCGQVVMSDSVLDMCNDSDTTSAANNNFLLDLTPDLLNVDLNMAHVGDEFPVINIEEANSLFEGIEANDMSTLLEQFETVAAVLEDNPEAGSVVSVSPIKPVRSQKTKESSTSTKNVQPSGDNQKKPSALDGLEVVKLLKKEKRSSRQTASAPSSPSSTPRPESTRYRIPKLKIKRTGSGGSSDGFTVTSSKDNSKLVTSSAPSSPQHWSCESTDKTIGSSSLRPNFYQPISDHDYCYRSPLPQYVDKNANEVNVRSLLQKKPSYNNNTINRNLQHRSKPQTSRSQQNGSQNNGPKKSQLPPRNVSQPRKSEMLAKAQNSNRPQNVPKAVPDSGINQRNMKPSNAPSCQVNQVKLGGQLPSQKPSVVSNESIKPATEDDGSVLKSLLLNNNIQEELARRSLRRTPDERKNDVIKKTIMEEMRKKAQEQQAQKDVKCEEEEINVVDMDISDGEEGMVTERFDKFTSEKIEDVEINTMEVDDGFDCNYNPVAQTSCSVNANDEQLRSFPPKEPNFRKRTYRNREPSPANEEFYDKLPNYFTALTTPSKPIGKPPVLVSNTVPERDRDPSPNRDGPVFDKMPAYFTCFTNSTKYDVSSKDPLGLEADSLSCELPLKMSCPSNASSRSHSPNLVIASQQNSRSNSITRQNSVSRPTSVSRPGSRSRPSSRRNSPSPSMSRRRRSSTSSSSSSSSHYSRSRSRSSRRSGSSHGSRSSRRSRSRHRRSRYERRRRRSYSSSSSSSRSRSRSRGRSRSYRSRSRSRSRPRRSFSRERSKLKQRQIEQRRIVYVGRISTSCTRQMLRKQFERFGEIEDVSVHFRERGGDNYGFITFCYTCDAYAAIEKGKFFEGMEHYDLCFGGRREFCKTEYADLDGNAEVEEEMRGVVGRPKASNDFDDLLRQATQRVKKH